MKKFLFVAILAAGSLVACNDTSNTVNGVDTTTSAYRDSVANAAGGSMNNTTPNTNSTTPDTSGTMNSSSDTSSRSNMMSDTSSTMMKSDTTHK